MKLVEVDALGNVIDDDVEAGYYIKIGSELVTKIEDEVKEDMNRIKE